MARLLHPVAAMLAGMMLCAGAAATAAAATSQAQSHSHSHSHIFLVQNSGWMEPFYSDPGSPFKPLVAALAGSVVQPGDALVLAAFNQSQPGAPSPRALLSFKAGDEPVRARVTAALSALELARKPGADALADTDLGEALQAAIKQALGGKPGIVWLVTNNRNSPNNDQATAARNREFYRLIHGGGAIERALAFPLRMPVKGEHYSANGLMLYAFAIGREGGAALDALLASGRMRQVITEAPARLKPLDRDTVRLAPRRVVNAPGVTFVANPDGTLRADVAPGARTPQARIEWNLENTIYPYTIAAATLTARSTLAGEERQIALDTDRVRDLAPGRPAPLASNMALPVAQIPDKWSLAALQSAGSAYVLPGRIELHLAGQQLALSHAFRSRMAELFPGDPLPDIFTPPARVQASTAVLPVQVRVHYGMGPLAAVVGAALALLALLAGGAMAWARPRLAHVTVNDETHTLRGRAGTTQPVYDRAGQQVAQLKTTLFGHQLLDVRDGAQVTLGHK